MVIVRLRDKRYHKGYNMKFFHTDAITKEIVSYVCTNPKAYWVECESEIYRSREEFLKAYGNQ